MSKYLSLYKLIDLEPETTEVLRLCSDEDILEEFQQRINYDFCMEFLTDFCTNEDLDILFNAIKEYKNEINKTKF